MNRHKVNHQPAQNASFAANQMELKNYGHGLVVTRCLYAQVRVHATRIWTHAPFDVRPTRGNDFFSYPYNFFKFRWQSDI